VGHRRDDKLGSKGFLFWTPEGLTRGCGLGFRERSFGERQKEKTGLIDISYMGLGEKIERTFYLKILSSPGGSISNFDFLRAENVCCKAPHA